MDVPCVTYAKMNILMTCFSIWICSVNSQTNENLKTLQSDLFASYSSKIRPVVNQLEPLQLDVSFYLSSVNEVNEVKEKMVTTGYLELSWTDELLKWTPSNYNNTEFIFVPQVNIYSLIFKNTFLQ